MSHHRPARCLIGALLALAFGLCACGTKRQQPVTDKAPPPQGLAEGIVRITYFGHDAFLIADDLRIMIAPHDERVGYGMGEVWADVVLIANSDADREQAKIVETDPRIIDKPGEHVAKGVKFRAIACAGHGEIIYCFELNGVRFCHLRLAHSELTAEQVKAIRPVDVLMLPVGNPYRMGDYSLDAKEAWKAVEQLNPNMILPMHYQTEKTKPELGLDKIDAFLKIASAVNPDGRRRAVVQPAGAHTMAVSESALATLDLPMVYVIKPW